MSNNENDKFSKMTGHKLKSRRDFLSHGLVSMNAMVMMPGIYTLLKEKQAFGAPTCQVLSGSQSMTPVVIFDLAGGANIPGSNVMVGKQGGQKDALASYRSLGLPPDIESQLDEDLGLAFHADSAILRGIKSVTQATTNASIDGAVFCAASGDDTGNNPHNPMYWLNQAGLNGQLTNLVGSRSNVSGGRSSVPAGSVNPAARPVQITRPQDALGLVDLGKLATMLDAPRAERVMKSVEKMSSLRLAMFQAKSLPDQIRDLIQCGYIKSSDLINQFDDTRVNPARDEDVQTIFDVNGGGDELKAASIAKLVIDGLAGAGTVELGGYDYHGGRRARGELADERAGRLIGKTLELAAAKRKNLMIYVFTDGGVSSNGAIDNSANGRGKGEWNSDSGLRSSAFALVYKADGRPAIRDGNRQIGYFRDNGTVETSANLISNSVENLSKALTANYLALHGKEGELDKAVGNNPFGDQLEQYLAFNKII